ncbi:MAG: sulfite exporter TauE/SafE family protein [SAR202 cluster bacterium]|nr:sulfite exporter TauE/SafE family protein [SAR202 cluster bacterium]
MPELPILIAALMLIFGTAIVNGVTGFGYNILAIPLLALLLEPEAAITAVIVHNVALNGIVLFDARKSVRPGRIWLLTLAGAVATPFGALILRAVDPGPLRVFIGAMVTLTGIAMLTGFRKAIRNESVASGVVGGASGLLSGSIGAAGPPVILFFANQGMDPREFRANIVAFFNVMTYIAIVSFISTGVMTVDRATLGMMTMPAAVLGVVLGIRLHGRVPAARFRKLTLALVLVAGVSAMYAGVRAL